MQLGPELQVAVVSLSSLGIAGTVSHRTIHRNQLYKLGFGHLENSTTRQSDFYGDVCCFTGLVVFSLWAGAQTQVLIQARPLSDTPSPCLLL